MKMNPCRFCGETSRLGAVTKIMKTGGYYGQVAAYARCKRCNARGPLVKLNSEVIDIRNERLSERGKAHLIELAVEAWNNGLKPEPLPLFSEEEGVKKHV